jgi:hypothetical protein
MSAGASPREQTIKNPALLDSIPTSKRSTYHGPPATCYLHEAKPRAISFSVDVVDLGT